MSNRTTLLRQIVDTHDLNNHPFYQAWRMGTLPAGKLTKYAADYEAFVGNVAEAWETLNRADYADEEREHHELWKDFMTALGSKPGDRTVQTEVLLTATKNLFAGSHGEALGALYAFERQQPALSRTKLEGLVEHYPSIDEKGREYFRVHADDWVEAEILEAEAEKLSDDEFQRAVSACRVASSAMWLALDGFWYDQKPTA